MKRQIWCLARLAFAVSALPLLTIDATAQIAVSANDNKAVLVTAPMRTGQPGRRHR